MKTNQPKTTGLQAGITGLFVFLFFIFQEAAFAELKEMKDAELKSTRLNDFIRPLNRAIIVAEHEEFQEDISTKLKETEAPVVVITEEYNPEAFLNDMKAQLDAVNKGESPILGLFPLIRNEDDKQHLVK